MLMLVLAMVTALIPISILSAADARSRAVAAADLIAMAGCEAQVRINHYRDTEVLQCSDDGIAVSVQTRTRISLPLRLGLVLYVHAQAQAVHAL